VLDEALQRFSESNRQFSSRELADTYRYVKGFLTKGIVESPVTERQYREDNYFQIKALDALMTTLISGWK
jgi:hypothetical protein